MLAALLGALSLFHAAPAEAGHTLGTPTNLQAQAGNGQVTLTWTAGTNNVHYDVAHGEHPSGALTTQLVSGTANPTVTITGLTNGTTYRFRVMARAHSGHSASAWTGFVTATPAAQQTALPQFNTELSFYDPTNLVVAAGDQSLNLTWTNNYNNNVEGAGHWVQYKTAAATSWTTSTSSLGRTATSHSITGLENGTEYNVRIFAVATVTGNVIVRGSFVTGSGTPVAPAVAAPTGLTVRPGNARLDFSWAAVSGANYYVAAYTSSSTVAADAALRTDRNAALGWRAATVSGTSGSITGLVNGTEYRVRVQAVVTGPPEARSAFVVGTGTPGTPQLTGLSLSAGGNAVTLSPGFAAGTTSYTATVPSGTTSVSVTVTWTSAPFQVTAGSATTGSPTTAITASTSIASSGGSLTVNLASSGTTRVWVLAGAISYDIIVTRQTQQSTDATLSALTASSSTSAGGTFTALGIGTFAASTTTYTASVANARTHVKLTPTVSDSNATVAVRKGTTGNFASVTSGSASAAIPLDVGSNAITVRVTAQDSTTKDYTVTVTRQNTVTPVTPSSIVVTLGPASLSVNEGKKAILNLAFSGCKNNNYVGIPVITTRVTSESGWRLSRGPSGKGGISPDVLSYGPDHDFGLGRGNPAQQRHTLTPPTHSCGSGDVYIDTYRDCDTEDETFTVELNADTRWPVGYGRGSQYKVEVTIIDDGGQEFCTRTPPPARQPADQPPPNTEETDTGDSTPATPANTGGGGGGGGGGGDLPPSGSSDEPPPEDEELSTLCSQEDRETLGNFYETTGGENWDENENWNSPEPLDQWYGVDTDDAGEVVSLRLSHNALSGEVPARELLCLSELKELALWGNDLPGEVPEKLVLAVERAVLRDIAEMLKINPEWFDNYGDPYNFEDWHEGVTTDDDGRVVELDLTGEGVLGEVPESSSELKRLREIMITSSGGGGCALRPEDNSSAFSLFLLALLVFAALGRTRARG